MTGRAYVHGESAEPSLAEIHQEMSELLGKQLMHKKRTSSFVTQAPASAQKSVQ